jgi:hypothetical protein
MPVTVCTKALAPLSQGHPLPQPLPLPHAPSPLLLCPQVMGDHVKESGRQLVMDPERQKDPIG